MITFQCIDVSKPVLDYNRVRSWIDEVVSIHHHSVGELHYYFCTDEKLLEINKLRLGHDFYTDIITFPLTDCVDSLSSEFCISLDRIADNASQFSRSYDNELCRVLIHGVLHLLGFDDKIPEDEKLMRQKEEECLLLLSTPL